jgi:hypothetical protein
MAAEAQEVIDALARPLADQAISFRAAELQIDCRLLGSQPRHLIREALLVAWKQAGWPEQHMGFCQWDRLAELVLETGDAASIDTLPGTILVHRKGERLILRRAPDARPIVRS